VVEHFNDTFDKHFFRSERFRDRTHLKARMRPFERSHNAHHRYSALKGATPDEVTQRLGFRPRLLDPAYRIPAGPPRPGRIEFIRLIRSDRLLRVMDERITLPEGLVYEYVTAVLGHRPSEARRSPLRSACQDPRSPSRGPNDVLLADLPSRL
jgi:hypothetical protein